MKNSVLLFLTIFFVTNLHSQNYSTSIPFTIKKGGKSFSFSDKSEDKCYLFIANQKKVKVILYDSTIEIIDSLSAPLPEIKSKDMIGFTKMNSVVNLIWMSDNSNKICFQSFDFSAKKTATTCQELTFNKESLLQTYSSNDYFYCLSLVDNSSVLKLYVFNNKNELEVKTIDLSATTFYDSTNKKANLSDVMSEKFGDYESSYELQNIDIANPTSLSIGSKKRKSYKNNNELFLTFDNSILVTQVIKINLTSFEASTIAMKTVTAINNAKGDVQSNSFFYENALYQFKISSTDLAFSIKNLDGKVLQEYIINAKDTIPFRGSADFVWQLVNTYTTPKIENTSQFLSTLVANRIGVTCYNYKGKNLISLGGISKKIKKIDEDENQPYFYNSGMKGGIAGGLWAASFLIFRSNGFAENYISGRDVLSMNTVFSKDFVLQSDKVNQYATTKISNFFNGFSVIKYPTIFSIKDKTFVGHYNEDAKQFVVLKFEN